MPPRSLAPPSLAPPVPEGPLHTRLAQELLAGGVSGALLITYGLAFAALIFAGDLGRHLPAGVGALLLSAAVLAGVVAVRSSFKPAIASPQETTSVLLALIAAAIAKGASATPDDVLPTIIAAFVLTAAVTGALFAALGLLGLGKSVRYIPYPVIGGFLAGTGWLLVRGALAVLTGKTLDVHNLGELFTGGALLRWIPGLAFGVLMAVLVRRFRRHAWVLPTLIAAGPVLFYAILGASGRSADDAAAQGLLLGPFAPGKLWPAVQLSDLQHVRWSLLGDNVGVMIALVLLASISILLKAASLELASGQEIDLDRELRATGLANLVAGALGVPPGYLALNESAMNHALRARTRLPGFVAAAICLLALALGQYFLPYFPRPVLGGILAFLGLSILVDAIYASWFRLPRVEYAILVLILFVMVTVGFLEGVILGVVISAVQFALSYGRISVIKHVISGALLRSKASRPATSEALLQQQGDQIHIFKLQGYLFFGTAYKLLTKVQERMHSPKLAQVNYVIMDFGNVDGIDSSAVLSFAKMRKLAEAQKVTLIFTALPRGVRRQLERGGCIDPRPADAPAQPEPDTAYLSVRVFPDLDHGLEWCEDRILDANADSRPSTDVITRELEGMSRHRDLVAELARYLERVEAPVGYDLFFQGESSGDLYLIEAGEVAAWLELEGGREKRLRTMGPGSVVGEAGLYLGAPRSASVRTTRPSVLHRLTTAKLAQMTREAPRLAAAFHRFVAELLAERVVNTTTQAQMVFY